MPRMEYYVHVHVHVPEVTCAGFPFIGAITHSNCEGALKRRVSGNAARC